MKLWLEGAPDSRRLTPDIGMEAIRRLLLDSHRLLLGLQTEFSSLESVRLRHRHLRPMETVQNQIPEKGKPHLPVAAQMVLASVIHQKEMVPLQLRSHV